MNTVNKKIIDNLIIKNIKKVSQIFEKIKNKK